MGLTFVRLSGNRLLEAGAARGPDPVASGERSTLEAEAGQIGPFAGARPDALPESKRPCPESATRDPRHLETLSLSPRSGPGGAATVLAPHRRPPGDREPRPKDTRASQTAYGQWRRPPPGTFGSGKFHRMGRRASVLPWAGLPVLQLVSHRR